MLATAFTNNYIITRNERREKKSREHKAQQKAPSRRLQQFVVYTRSKDRFYRLDGCCRSGTLLACLPSPSCFRQTWLPYAYSPLPPSAFPWTSFAMDVSRFLPIFASSLLQKRKKKNHGAESRGNPQYHTAVVATPAAAAGVYWDQGCCSLNVAAATAPELTSVQGSMRTAVVVTSCCYLW